MYSEMGRPSVAPEKLLRALLLQVLYTVRSERMLMEQLDPRLGGGEGTGARPHLAARCRAVPRRAAGSLFHAAHKQRTNA
jgi:hypothetical protein